MKSNKIKNMNNCYSPKELAKHFSKHCLETDAMESMIKSCVKENNNELVLALKELVYLQDLKDKEGKASFYNKLMPETLKRAKKVLANLS